MSSERNMAWGAALAALALIGGALAFDPGAGSAQTPKIALILGTGVVLLALALPRWWRAGQGLRRGPLMAMLVGGWQLSSLAWSPHPDPTTASLWVAMAAIAVALGSQPDAARRLLTGRVATAIVAGASGAVIVQTALGAEGVARHGGMGNPNWLGLSLAAALPLALGHAFERPRLERAVTGGAALLGLVGLAMSGSRVALVALIVAGVTGLAIAAPRRRRLAAWGAAAVAVAAGLALAFDTGTRAALGGRLWLGRVGMDAWHDAPWIGHGQGGFSGAFLAAQGDRLALLGLDEASRRFVYVTTAHDDWLQLAIEGGLVALGLGLLLWAVALFDLRRWPAGLASLIAVGVAMIGDAPLHQPAVTVVMALVLAETSPLPAPRRRGQEAGLVVGALVALAILLPGAATRWLAERRAQQDRRTPSAALASLEGARAIAPSNGEIALELGLAELQLGDAAGALEAFAAAKEAGLASLALPLAEGNASLRLGRPTEAVAAYRRALRIHPASFVAHANLAEAHRQQGRLDEARRHLRAAQELQPHHQKLAAIDEAVRKATIHQATSVRP